MFCKFKSLNPQIEEENSNIYYHNGSKDISEFEIPNSFTEIGENAFTYCESLTKITIPNSVTKIGEEAFSFCKLLTSIIIPNSVTEIGGGAFYYCSSLTNITIPNSVTEIGDYVFSFFFKNIISFSLLNIIKANMKTSFRKKEISRNNSKHIKKLISNNFIN